MKLGACDYLTKPFPLSELEHRCGQAAEVVDWCGRIRTSRRFSICIARDSDHWRIRPDERSCFG